MVQSHARVLPPNHGENRLIIKRNEVWMVRLRRHGSRFWAAAKAAHRLRVLKIHRLDMMQTPSPCTGVRRSMCGDVVKDHINVHGRDLIKVFYSTFLWIRRLT